MVSEAGLTYPVWDFDNVDISASAQGRSIDFWLDVSGVATHATRWTFSTATPTPTPTPIATPTPAPSDDSAPTDGPTPQPTPTPPLTWQQRPTSSCQ